MINWLAILVSGGFHLLPVTQLGSSRRIGLCYQCRALVEGENETMIALILAAAGALSNSGLSCCVE
jgi:hypothetical protein